MSDRPTDVVLSASVVSFDGRVLELFGHSSQTGNRIHVALITGIVEEPDQVKVSTKMTEYTIYLSQEGEAQRAEIGSLIAAVRAAAPALAA